MDKSAYSDTGSGLGSSGLVGKELSQLPKKVRRLKAALMIYGAWNIWKARNKCAFEQRSSTPAQVVHDIKEEASCRTLACGSPELSLFNV
jgi:hypothetical protein